MIKKSKSKSTPEINTASLPDIIFILLFFFMVVTVMREVEQKVSVNYPKATELTKLERRTLVANIYLGPPTEKHQGLHGTAPSIQLNDRFATTNEIFGFIQDSRKPLSEIDQRKFTVSLKVDEEVKMGIVSDLKQELRKASTLKVNYSAVSILP